MNKKTRKKDALDTHVSEMGIDPNVDPDMQQFSQQIEIAEMIYAARQAAGLTQKELADAIGTKQQVISQLENADYEGHSLSMLRRIAKALHRRVEIRMVPEESDNIPVW
ncbi:MAG: helix-turn-helix transcriptional regulator [Pirellulales bacterium]|nr:helix-turn-helix transcriptional regulator [Pirellulales bacterium]